MTYFPIMEPKLICSHFCWLAKKPCQNKLWGCFFFWHWCYCFWLTRKELLLFASVPFVCVLFLWFFQFCHASSNAYSLEQKNERTEKAKRKERQLQGKNSSSAFLFSCKKKQKKTICFQNVQSVFYSEVKNFRNFYISSFHIFLHFEIRIFVVFWKAACFVDTNMFYWISLASLKY